MKRASKLLGADGGAQVGVAGPGERRRGLRSREVGKRSGVCVRIGGVRATRV